MTPVGAAAQACLSDVEGAAEWSQAGQLFRFNP